MFEITPISPSVYTGKVQCAPALCHSCVIQGIKSVPHTIGFLCYTGEKERTHTAEFLCYTGEKERTPHCGIPVLHRGERAYPYALCPHWYCTLGTKSVPPTLFLPSVVGVQCFPQRGVPGCSPPPPFLTWFPLMWSLECLICFDLMEKLYLPPPLLLLLGGNTRVKSQIA